MTIESPRRRGLMRAAAAALLAMPPALSAQPSMPVPSSPVDRISIYVLPTDGIPEQLAVAIARELTEATGLGVKASGWMPSGDLQPFPDTVQYAAEDYIALGVPVTSRLRDASARTYFIVVTDRDINARARNFRFQYSLHAPMARTSVLSVARLLHNADGSAASRELVAERMRKMLLRIAGEMRLGWQRTADPLDLMYAPIMSIADVDRMSLVHTVKRRKPKQSEAGADER